MQSKTVKNVLPKQDVELLYQLYKNRALSTAQIMHIRKLSKWYVYKILGDLRKKGYIYTNHIKGNYIIGQTRQGNYHRISNKGIRLLKKNGYMVNRTANELRVTTHRLPYLLVGHDLCIRLQDLGWEYTDSRAIKMLKQLNKGDMLHGTLINPNGNKEYCIYILLQTIQPNTLKSIKREIMRNPFENILVIARGLESYQSVIKSFTDKHSVIKGGSVKVLPFQFAQSYLNISSDNYGNHKHFLTELGLELLSTPSNKNVFETNIDFDYLVKHNGEEKYFMDMLDNDLMKLRTIGEYRKERYKRDGRKVLVLTSNADFHYNFHKEALKLIKHVEFMPISAKQVVTFATQLSNKKG